MVTTISVQGRLRAGLRAALRTECSGFRFQTGGSAGSSLLCGPRGSALDGRYACIAAGHTSLLRLKWGQFWREEIEEARREEEEEEDEEAGGGQDAGEEEADSRMEQQLPRLVQDGGLVPPLRTAMCMGFEDTLRWLVRENEPLSAALRAQCRVAFSFEILGAEAMRQGWEWFLAAALHPNYPPASDDSRTCSRLAVAALRSGSLIWVERFFHARTFNLFDNSLLSDVLSGSSLEMAEWLRRTGRVDFDALVHDAPGNEHQVAQAAANGERGLALLQWMVRDWPQWPGVVWLQSERTVESAAQAGSLCVLEWLVDMFGCRCSSRALEAALLSGHKGTAQYIVRTAPRALERLNLMLCTHTLAKTNPEMLEFLLGTIQRNQTQRTDTEAAAGAGAASAMTTPSIILACVHSHQKHMPVLCWLARYRATPSVWREAVRFQHTLAETSGSDNPAVQSEAYEALDLLLAVARRVWGKGLEASMRPSRCLPCFR